jgi:hypothetical protein
MSRFGEGELVWAMLFWQPITSGALINKQKALRRQLTKVFP